MKSIFKIKRIALHFSNLFLVHDDKSRVSDPLPQPIFCDKLSVESHSNGGEWVQGLGATGFYQLEGDLTGVLGNLQPPHAFKLPLIWLSLIVLLYPPQRAAATKIKIPVCIYLTRERSAALSETRHSYCGRVTLTHAGDNVLWFAIKRGRPMRYADMTSSVSKATVNMNAQNRS